MSSLENDESMGADDRRERIDLATVTVGVIAKRRIPALLALLEHLHSLEDESPGQVVVAVECPDAADVREERDELGTRWLDIPAHRGFGFNRNCVVRAATGDVLVFVDDDCEPAPGWLPRLVAPLAAPGIDAVVGRLHVGPSGVLGQSIAALGFPGGGAAGFETMFVVREDSTTDNICTCNCAIKMSVFDVLGGFDEALTYGGEDTDLAERMTNAGMTIRWEPDAEVSHPARTSLIEFAGWFFRRGRAKRQFVTRSSNVGTLVHRRLASYGKILSARRRDPKIVIILPLLIASVLFQQAGFVAEWLFPDPRASRRQRAAQGPDT